MGRMYRKYWGILLLSLLTLTVYGQNTQVQANPDRIFRDGYELLEKEKYAAAQHAFDQYRALNLHDALSIEAEYYSATCALFLMNPDAERKFHSFVKAHPEHPKAIRAYYDLGTHYFKQENFKQAIEYFEKVLPESLDKDAALERNFKLGYSYFKDKKVDKAAPIFNSIKTGNYKYIYAANYYAGYSNYKLENYPEAEKDLKKAQENAAYKPLVPVMLMIIYYKQQRYDEMLAYTKALEAEGIVVKPYEEFYLLAGDAAYSVQNYPKAIEYMDKFSKPEHMVGDTLYRYAYAEYQTEKFADAIKNFKRLSVLNNKLGQYAAYYMGLAYLRQNNKPFALNAFTTAYGYGKDSLVTPSSMFYAGKLNYDLGKYHESALVFRSFVKKYPADTNRTDAVELFGEALLKSNHYDEAINYIEGLKKRSERINKAYQKVTFIRGVELFNDNNYEGALALFKKSLNNQYDREVADLAHFWSGEALSIEKKYEDAIFEYESISKVSESKIKSFYGIGYAHYNLKKYDKALIDFKEYIEEPTKISHINYVDAKTRLADCYYVGRKYNEALKLYNELLSRNETKDIDYVVFQKASLLSVKGDLSEASETYDIIVKKFPESRFYDKAIYEKAELDFEQGHYQNSVHGFTMLLHNNPKSALTSKVLLKRGLANDNLKSYDLAMEDFKRILNDYPESAEATGALEGIQDILAHLERMEEFTPILDAYKIKNPNSEGIEGIEFASAKTLYNNEKYAQVIKSLEAYMATYSNTINMVDGRYYLADSYLKTKDTTNAYKWFKAVVADNSGSFLNRAIRACADLEFAAKKYNDSRLSYESWLARVSSKKDQINAWLGLTEVFYKLSNNDSCVYFGKKVVDAGNASINAGNKATLLVAKAYLAKGDNANADEYILRLMNGPNDDYAAEATFMLAKQNYDQKDYANSLNNLFILNEKFGGKNKWLDQSYLLIADNYVAMGESFQAKATLKSIIEHSPNKETVAIAKDKLALITGTKDDEEGEDE